MEVRMRGFIFFVGLMVIAAIAHAVTYKWTDSSGGVHFTDNLDKVPAKYLNKVRKVDVDTEIPKNEQPSRLEQKTIAPPAQKLLGGHDEMWWRSSFKVLRGEIKAIQNGLPGKKDELSNLRRKYVIFNKPSTRVAYNELNADIEKDEARIEELQKQLATLDDAAAKAGVPMKWRR